MKVETPSLDRPQVLLGARPCDAHALEVMDRLLLDDPVDLYYAERRARTTLVGLACADGPWEGCFCTTVGGGPAERGHLDVLLAPVDGGYAVDVVSEKGRALVASAALEALGGASAPARARRRRRSRWPRPRPGAASFDDAYWGELAERCLGCRTCTYDCPVCYCFDVRDRRLADGRVERLRCWDSCQGASCFAIAGGHNPRPTQAQRLRQRYMHKFLYYPAREDGAALCVGCGRCVVQCPVNVDIREVLAHVAEARHERHDSTTPSFRTSPSSPRSASSPRASSSSAAGRSRATSASTTPRASSASSRPSASARRPFGMAVSERRGDGQLEFAVQRIGTVTDALHEMQTGDVVGVRGPMGQGLPARRAPGPARRDPGRRHRPRTAAPAGPGDPRPPRRLRGADDLLRRPQPGPARVPGGVRGVGRRPAHGRPRHGRQGRRRLDRPRRPHHAGARRDRPLARREPSPSPAARRS